jgi:hypothetical protein
LSPVIGGVNYCTADSFGDSKVRTKTADPRDYSSALSVTRWPGLIEQPLPGVSPLAFDGVFGDTEDFGGFFNLMTGDVAELHEFGLLRFEGSTYRPQPEAGHELMTLGIKEFRDPKELRLDLILTRPFRPDEKHAVETGCMTRTFASYLVDTGWRDRIVGFVKKSASFFRELRQQG